MGARLSINYIYQPYVTSFHLDIYPGLATIGLPLSDGCYHYRATIGLELELEVASRAAVIGLPLSDGCSSYHYRDYLACAE